MSSHTNKFIFFIFYYLLKKTVTSKISFFLITTQHTCVIVCVFDKKTNTTQTLNHSINGGCVHSSSSFSIPSSSLPIFMALSSLFLPCLLSHPLQYPLNFHHFLFLTIPPHLNLSFLFQLYSLFKITHLFFFFPEKIKSIVCPFTHH